MEEGDGRAHEKLSIPEGIGAKAYPADITRAAQIVFEASSFDFRMSRSLPSESVRSEAVVVCEKIKRFLLRCRRPLLYPRSSDTGERHGFLRNYG